MYAVAYALKMSYKTSYKIEGFFEYVVPPLEGLWWQEGFMEYDSRQKDAFQWIALIRLPDFVKEKDLVWAKEEVKRKKKTDCEKVEFFILQEGKCVQIMHTGPFDQEPESVAKMDQYIKDLGYETDFSGTRFHHEIYLSDARKVDPEKWKTVIRHPIK